MARMNGSCLLVLFLVSAPLAVRAATYYVDGSNGNNGNSGADWTHAKATIAAGIAVAANGDVVLVAAGRYEPAAELLVSKAIAVQSARGAQVTTVDGAGLRRCFRIANSNAVVQGFTITGGLAPQEPYRAAYGGGVRMDGGLLQDCVVISNKAGGSSDYSHPHGGGIYVEKGTVRNCVISNNKVQSPTMDSGGSGGGIRGSDCSIENCLVAENEVSIANWDAQGAGLFIAGNSLVLNCTVVGNAVTRGSYQHGGGVFMSGGRLFNSIIWGNSAAYEPNLNASGTVVGNCCTVPAQTGTGNLATDPLFESATNWRLQTNSPCVDTGSVVYRTATDLDGKDRNPFAPDIGCYEKALNADFVAAGYTLSEPPQVQILSVSNRFRSNIVDIQYKVTDTDSPTVEVRGYAVTAALAGPEYRYSDRVYPLRSVVEGTAGDYGAGVTPAHAVKHLAWDAGTDVGQSMAGLRIELMANDVTNLPISVNFVSIPADTSGPAFRINQYSKASSDYQLRRAFLWALCRGIARKSGMDLIAVGGAYNGQTIATNDLITDAGKLWLCEQIGGVRLASAAEITRAREATTPGSVTKWPSYYRWGMRVNAYGVDTTDDNAWYLVEL